MVYISAHGYVQFVFLFYNSVARYLLPDAQSVITMAVIQERDMDIKKNKKIHIA